MPIGSWRGKMEGSSNLQNVLRQMYFLWATCFLLSACTVSDPFLWVENEETGPMLISPSKYFEPLPKYTIGGVTLFPKIVSSLHESKTYLMVTAHSKDPLAMFEITGVAENFTSREVQYVDLRRVSETRDWEEGLGKWALDDWYKQTIRLREYSYEELVNADLGRMSVSLDITVKSFGKEYSGTIGSEFQVSMVRATAIFGQ